MAQKERKRLQKKYFLAHIQILVKCFTWFHYAPGRYVGYLRQFLMFHPRNFDGQSRARYSEGIAHHLDENQNAPISCGFALCPPSPVKTGMTVI
jgi:hypothetical protein